jgi:hypothetical protein
MVFTGLLALCRQRVAICSFLLPFAWPSFYQIITVHKLLLWNEYQILYVFSDVSDLQYVRKTKDYLVHSLSFCCTVHGDLDAAVLRHRRTTAEMA